MQDKFKTLGHLALSILLALVLFFYATTTNYRNSDSAQQTESETYVHSLSNVPIEIKYDSTQYFISGFSSTVVVELRGSNRVLLQRESDESTRTFQVTADLTGLEADGTQTVKLQLANLPTGVSATITPETITIKIGKKVSKSFPVEGVVYSNQLAEGYSASKVSVNLDTVKVTTDEETLSKIDRIEAVALDVSNLSENYSGTAKLQAVDSSGNVLPVVLAQTEANMQITITKTN